MLMADAVSKLAAKTPGKEAVAMESYAKALRMVLAFDKEFRYFDLNLSITNIIYFFLH